MKTDRYLILAEEATELYNAYNHPDLTMNEVEKKVLDAAIDICREKARLYVTPCEGEATYNPDGSILVKRRRN